MLQAWESLRMARIMYEVTMVPYFATVLTYLSRGPAVTSFTQSVRRPDQFVGCRCLERGLL